MKPRTKIAPPLLELAFLVVLVVIGWAAFRVYEIVPEMDKSRERLRELRDEYVRIDEFVQTNITDLDDALTNFVQTRTTADLEHFDRIRKDAKRWLETQRSEAAAGIAGVEQTEPTEEGAATNHLGPGQPELIALLDQIWTTYSNYLGAAQYLIDNIGQPWIRDRMNTRVQQTQAAKSHLLDLARQSTASGDDMAWILYGSERWSRELDRRFRHLRFDSFVLVGLCVLALLALYGRRMFETRAVIRHHLEQQAKLDRLLHFGRLAQDHAHEIKQPLTAIKARLHTLQKGLAPGSGAQKDAAVIGTEINRLDQIVKDFLRQARPTEPRPVALNAEAALNPVRDLMASQLEQEGIEIKLEVEHDLELHADAQQLQQVLINLVKNAAESIEGRGTIILRARKGTHELNGKPGATGIIEIADTGRGIPPEIQERIFDPFFSTKEDGSGLGLAIAARIIDRHGGRLEFETHAGHGTTFRIVLPAGIKEPTA